jgi:hypothetical protein
MQGMVRTETMRAYTAEEMQRIIKKLPLVPGCLSVGGSASTIR